MVTDCKVKYRILSTLLLAGCCLSEITVADISEQDTLQLAQSFCTSPDSVPPTLENYRSTEQDIPVRAGRITTSKIFESDTDAYKLETVRLEGQPGRMALTASTVINGNTLPTVRLTLSDECELIQAQRIVYDNQTALYAELLDQNLTSLSDRQWLNPPVPDDIGKKSGLRVALIDSGVNYLLEEIQHALAVDNQGAFIGYDFWDNDNTPFDANPARSPFFIQRHGTRTASILIREAPNIALVPYRYPRPDMTRMQLLIRHAAKNGVRIIGMPLGSNRKEDWLPFSAAVKEHPNILFIVSAGNNGRNIDSRPVYPASLDHPNILVVTSSDDFVRPAERTNYGSQSVDYMLPAEQLPATDYSGEQVSVSGSSYAVARLTGLAARLLEKDVRLTVEELKEQINEFTIRARTDRYVSTGYLADPLADTSDIHTQTDTVTINTDAVNQLPIEIVALDNRWTKSRINEALEQVNSIYRQCDMGVTTTELIRVDGAPYLANLSPGSALTLHRHLNRLHKEAAPVTVFFANDTDMQVAFDAEAFGIGNTNNRPWMRNTVWISEITQHSGNALAHELFHVLANNGNHNELTDNLMRDRTGVSNVALTASQCEAAIRNARTNELTVSKPTH